MQFFPSCLFKTIEIILYFACDFYLNIFLVYHSSNTFAFSLNFMFLVEYIMPHWRWRGKIRMSTECLGEWGSPVVWNCRTLSPLSTLPQLSNPCSSSVYLRQIKIIWCNLLMKGSCGLYPPNCVLFWTYSNNNKIYSLLTVYYGLITFWKILHVFLILNLHCKPVK